MHCPGCFCVATDAVVLVVVVAGAVGDVTVKAASFSAAVSFAGDAVFDVGVPYFSAPLPFLMWPCTFLDDSEQESQHRPLAAQQQQPNAQGGSITTVVAPPRNGVSAKPVAATATATPAVLTSSPTNTTGAADTAGASDQIHG